MRALLVACLPVLLLTLAPIAFADGEETPAPPAWSNPQGVPATPDRAVDPTGGARTAQLPPPRVINLRGGQRPPSTPAYVVQEGPRNIAATPPPPPPPSAPASTIQSGANDAPTGRMAEPPSGAPAPTAEGSPDTPPAAEPFVMPTTSKVISIGKNHNQAWRGNWLALELDMLLAVVGQSGHQVGVAVSFFETVNGQPLRAAMQPYVDGEGNVSVYTKLVPIQSSSRLFRSRLRIPYRAFPWPTKGPAYGVEARVRLIQRDAAGNFTVLAHGETSFTLHFERQENCGRRADSSKPCGTALDRALRYDWEMMWGEDGAPKLSEAGLAPPKGTGPYRAWYEGRWRTKGGTVDRKEEQWGQ